MTLIAQQIGGPAPNNALGNITKPTIIPYQGDVTGLTSFFNNAIRLLILIGGIYAFINIILAGYAFLSAGDDAKKLEGAWAKIWQSLVGLIFIIGSFTLAGVFGYILFKNPAALLRIVIYGP